MYSGDEGEVKIDTKDWPKHRVIFCTPTIVYGCDAHTDGDVFGFYFNANHFDSMDINQQINRERNPRSMHLYLAPIKSKPYDSMKQCEAESSQTFGLSYNAKIRDAREYLKAVSVLTDLIIYEEYRKSHHLNIRFHVPDLLRSKGYTNITHVPDSQSIIGFKALNRKSFNQINNKKLLDAYADSKSESKACTDIQNKLKVFGFNDKETFRKFILERVRDEHKIKTSPKSLSKSKEKEIIELIETTEAKYMDLFVGKGFDSLLNYTRFTNPNYYAFNDKYEVQGFDHISTVLKGSKAKIQLLRELRDKLGIPETMTGSEAFKSVCSTNHDEDIESIDSDFLKQLKTAFRSRKKDGIQNHRALLTSFYMSKMKMLMPEAIITKLSNKKCKKMKYSIRYISKIFYVDNEHKIYNLHDIDENTLYLI